MTDYSSINSLCIVYLHGIGDFLFLTPSLRKIKSINPDIRITVVLREELKLRRLAEKIEFIDEVLEISLDTHPRIYVPWIFWSSEYWTIRRKVREALEGRSFDRVLMPLVQIFPTIAYLLFAPWRVRVHKINKVASELGLSLSSDEQGATWINLPLEMVADARHIISDLAPVGATVIGIQRNTLDRTRQIDFDATQEFIDRLNDTHDRLFFIVFADSLSYDLEEEADGGHLEADNLRYSLDITHHGDSLDLAALVACCDYVLSVDSAVFNIANALKKNTIGVFNNYKVRSEHRALPLKNVLCIDSPSVTADDIMERFGQLALLRKGADNA